MNLFGLYVGIVEKNSDPEKLGRLKVRVPHVYGIAGSVVGAIPMDELPWAIPMGLPAGGSSASGGMDWLPGPGDQVAIQFLDGEPEKPVWSWLMQTQSQAKALKLHQYDTNAKGEVGSPNRGLLTRYSSSVELKSDKVTLTTREGQQALLQTSQSTTGGTAALQTPKGQSVTLNDLSDSVVIQALESAVVSGKRVILNAPTSALVKTERFTLLAGTSIVSVQGNTITITTESGATLVIDETGNVAISSAGGSSIALETGKVMLGETGGTGLVLETGLLSINAPACVMNTAAFSIGTAVGFPLLMVTPQTRAWIMWHTHTNGNNGSPTGPPIPIDPDFPVNSASTRVRTT